MFMKFIGAAEGVTGSCTWLYHPASDTQLLVDCGLYQGADHEVWLNHQPFEFDPKKIKYLLLTHAHIDHCGLIGKLVREGFKGKVYCTNATARVAEEMLLDGAGFSDSEYTKADVGRIQWSRIDYSASEIAEQRCEFKWGKIYTLAPGLTLSPWRSSHVLGACGFSINWNDQGDKSTYAERSIFFSGDIGCQSSQNCYLPMMKKNHAPPPYTDFLVMESTYGSRVREDQYKSSAYRIRALERVITDTKERGGTLVIPAFAFHRTQEILTDLFTIGLEWKDSGKGDLQCYLDSPLSNRLNKVYGEELPRLLSSTRPPKLDRQYLRDDLYETTRIHTNNIGKLFKNLSNGKVATSGSLKVIPSDGGDEGDKKKNKKKAFKPEQALKDYDVVVVSGGMCDQGTITRYLSLVENKPRNTLLLTGYQASGSKGRQLLESERVDAACKIEDLSSYYSGHADQAILLDYLFELNDRKQPDKSCHVFINHGESDSKNVLREAMQRRAAEKRVSDRIVSEVLIGQKKWFDLSNSTYIDNSPVPTELTVNDLNRELSELKNMLATQSREMAVIRELLKHLTKEKA